jgi:hypothetical protein
MTGVLEHIRKDVKNEIQKESDVKLSSNSTNEIPVFTIDYTADIIPINQQFKFPEFITDIPFVDENIPIKSTFLSDYFLRPPPTF